jgi:hypothetical protein
MAGATARAALRWKGLADVADANALSQNLAEDVDGKLTIWGVGTIGARPAAGTAGRVYRSTDDDRVALDVGPTWRKLIMQAASGDYLADTNVDAAGFKVSGVSLASTHLSDSAALARLASPTFTGDPKAPTPAPGDNDTSIATTAFVQNVISSSPVLGGDPKAPTPALNDNDTSIPTTAWVRSEMQAAATKIRAKSGTAGQVEMGDVGVSSAAGISFSNVNPATLQYDGSNSLKINGPNSNFTADQIIANAQFIGPVFKPTGYPGLQGVGVSAVSISGAAITPTHWIQRVISSGTLSTINGGQDHAVLILINVSGGVISTDAAGNIAGSSSIANNNHKMYVYLSSDSKWHPAN